MRMTEGSITGQMLRFMLPLFIGNLFQQLYNAADALIVGRMLGEQALAAVAGTGNLVFLIVSFFSGIASGAGVAISRYYGSKEPDKLQSAIHTSVAFGIFATVVLTLAGVIFSPALLRWMDTPEDVMAASVEYMSIYFAGSLSLVMYNTFRGIMQAVGDSRNPLIYLVISSIINVILDILFIKYIYAGKHSCHRQRNRCSYAERKARSHSSCRNSSVSNFLYLMVKNINSRFSLYYKEANDCANRYQ